jgi:hypothetical protein
MSEVRRGRGRPQATEQEKQGKELLLGAVLRAVVLQMIQHNTRNVSLACDYLVDGGNVRLTFEPGVGVRQRTVKFTPEWCRKRYYEALTMQARTDYLRAQQQLAARTGVPGAEKIHRIEGFGAPGSEVTTPRQVDAHP